ncbi:MAG: RNA-directed DNA polymerase [Chloroflexi bacterium]|nr:RNA-directed DNA polymerase [Chloroflexota bacterium]
MSDRYCNYFLDGTLRIFTQTPEVESMAPDCLEPRLDLLCEEYVLIQAFKKTARYIRNHNWFCDTLALDHAAVNLPEFLSRIQERLKSPEGWQNDPLRIIPAPKKQRWEIQEGKWKPARQRPAVPLRPLAHVSLPDQVLATALMLCIADRVEARQGSPALSINEPESRRQVISYGHRLFCDGNGSGLRHRWGSATLYRAYFEDYKRFLDRPEFAAKAIPSDGKRNLFLVHADLEQFYDRVRPSQLFSAVDHIRRDGDDPGFFDLVESLFCWSWHHRDQYEVDYYAAQAGIDHFNQVALPQGLVASGFFANVVLLALDEAVREHIGGEIPGGLRLVDTCRYVDDFRIVVEAYPDAAASPQHIKFQVSRWLQELLDEHAGGLPLSDEKTKIASLGDDGPPLVRQRAEMDHIQTAISGGFDFHAGQGILDSIQALVRAQPAPGDDEPDKWRFAPVADVHDDTVARFGARRYRKTFRSIRPLAFDRSESDLIDREPDQHTPEGAIQIPRTREDLDQDARVLAYRLVRRWLEDPSNVLLLQIGLDLWPDAELLREVLGQLRLHIDKGRGRGVPRRVAWYCLSQLFRAGATETGLVFDSESLPSGIDLSKYRRELSNEACRILAPGGSSIPWYLKQQVLLYLAAHDPAAAPFSRRSTAVEIRPYQELIAFLRGDQTLLANLGDSELAALAVLARRAFLDRDGAIRRIHPWLRPAVVEQIARRDPSLLTELLEYDAQAIAACPARVREDLCLELASTDRDRVTLAEAILNQHPTSTLRNELSVLRLADALLGRLVEAGSSFTAITPGQITMKLNDDRGVADPDELQMRPGGTAPSGSIYEPPAWCAPDERWRIQLGYLLRFILIGHPDFARANPRDNWREPLSYYRPAASHWRLSLHGMYSGQPAFGDDWLPMTEWLEGLLLALLRWPGTRAPKGFGWIEEGMEECRTRIGKRVRYLERLRGRATEALILPLAVESPDSSTRERTLRACVVQTVIPNDEDFCACGSDLELNGRGVRRRHRNHLSATLEAVKSALRLRVTHTDHQERLDWLILPELAVHHDDINTHLVPFARANKTQILAGLTYDRPLEGRPLVNSAIWIIPEWSGDSHGLQIRIRRQGKAHLAKEEQRFNSGGEAVVQGFRPCQWLIEFPWTGKQARPLRLTAAVCYDATDIGLAADLKNLSDVLAIPALNRDTRTFDQMALALHYHMFGLIVVANNGKYGGSNAYWPHKDSNRRRIFHFHGQPQSSIAFFEIGDIGGFLERHDDANRESGAWKYPPIGIRPIPTFGECQAGSK